MAAPWSFIASYVGTALWSSCGGDGVPLDRRHDMSDLAAETRADGSGLPPPSMTRTTGLSIASTRRSRGISRGRSMTARRRWRLMISG